MIGLLFREAFLTVFAQKLASVVTLILVAVMCAAVLLTSGKAEGNQQAVLSTIDSAGTRSIIVSASNEAGIEPSVLKKLGTIAGIESVVALGAVTDVRNSLLPNGTPVPMRDYWGSGIGVVNAGEALVSTVALQELGMQVAVGSVSNSQGVDVAVVGLIEDTSSLHLFEPLLLTPRALEDVGVVNVLVVVVTDASVVGAVTEVLRPMVAGTEAGQVRIETSEALAVLHGTINEQLGAFSVGLAAGALVIAGLLVAVVQSALVMLRRKDWGRRRALGASRQTITWLILAQTGIISVLGSIIGVFVSVTVLTSQNDPIPSVSFIIAVAILSVSVSLIAAILPAVVASRRDPIKELRVP